MNRLALLQIDVAEITDVLTASAPLEEGCFLLLREGKGVKGRRLLAVDPIFAPADGWEAQAPDQLRPSARWISATISRAIEEKAGLLFVHSHPNPAYPIGFSHTDRSAILSLSETIGPILEGPFAAAVVHPHGWVAAIAEEGELRMLDRIVAVGRTLRFLNRVDSAPARRVTDVPGLDDRQRDALGVVHELVRSLHVGVVGAGGLGSPIAEQLARMGAGEVTIVDHDALDTPSNVRRVFGSTISDLRGSEPPAKVDVVGRHLDQLGLSRPMIRVAADVRRESAFRQLLDTDIVICGTDTHGSRAVINELASTYLLPVIDVGVKAGAKKNGDLAALVAEVRVLTPTTPCLWCRNSISSDVIRAENLPPEQRQRLVQEGYIVGGVGEPAPSVIALTVLGSGLATCALLALLTGEGDVCPSGYIIDGLMGDGLETQPTEPEPNCRCSTQMGLGDTEPPPFIAETS
jgi:molybdopterin/thiamine biosynthesis adenylyltransferase